MRTFQKENQRISSGRQRFPARNITNRAELTESEVGSDVSGRAFAWTRAANFRFKIYSRPMISSGMPPSVGDWPGLRTTQQIRQSEPTPQLHFRCSQRI